MKLSLIAHRSYHSSDLTVFLLRELEARGALAAGAHVVYLNGLAAQAAQPN